MVKFVAHEEGSPIDNLDVLGLLWGYEVTWQKYFVYMYGVILNSDESLVALVGDYQTRHLADDYPGVLTTEYANRKNPSEVQWHNTAEKKSPVGQGLGRVWAVFAEVSPEYLEHLQLQAGSKIYPRSNVLEIPAWVYTSPHLFIPAHDSPP